MSEGLWKKYWKSRSDEARNALAELYLPVVDRLAGIMLQKLPHGVQVEDLKSCGFFGLLGAISRFDPERGVRFETYCVGRVRGAMLDSLRSDDIVPRLTRSRANRIEKAFQTTERKRGRPGTDVEVARELRVSLPTFDHMRTQIGNVLSPGAPIPKRKLDRDLTLPLDVTLMEDTRNHGPLVTATRKDFIKEGLRGLPRRDRFVLILYYLMDLDLEEIGLVLDLSESRVCQLHAKAMHRIQAKGKRWVA